MKHTTIALRDIKPNPFKKNILGGKLDEAKIARLEESIKQTGFWENVVLRKRGDEYQLGYGHHRHEAAMRVLGKAFEVNLPVMDLTDDQMLVMMAQENGTNETESVAAMTDVVVTSRNWLKGHPDACQFRPPGGRISTRPHEHGGHECVAAFLGETSWSCTKVGLLLSLTDKLDETVLSGLKNNASEVGEIGQKVGAALAQLPKQSQVAVAKVITSAEVFIPKHAVESVVRQVKQEQKSEGLSPAATGKLAVELMTQKVEEVEEIYNRKTTAVKTRLPKKATKENLPDINRLAFRLAQQIESIWYSGSDVSKLEQLIQFRHDIAPKCRKSLVSSLDRVVKRFESYRDQLNNEKGSSKLLKG